MSPSLAGRDVLDPHQSQGRVTQSKSTGVRTPHLRVPRWRGSPSHGPRAALWGPKPTALGRRQWPAGRRRWAPLPGALAASEPAPWLWVAPAHPAAPGAFPAERPLFVTAVSARPPVHPACHLLPLVGLWDYRGDPTLSTHQRIHIRGNGCEHPRTQEHCQGAGDARLCQGSAGGLLGLPLPLKDACFDGSRGVMDAPGFAALCPRLLPRPWAGIEASHSRRGPGGIYLHWQDWESVIKLSIAVRPLRRGGCSLPSRGCRCCCHPTALGEQPPPWRDRSLPCPRC